MKLWNENIIFRIKCTSNFITEKFYLFKNDSSILEIPSQVYVQNLRVKEPLSPRKLLCTFKGKESRRFTRCFHGWTHFKTHAGSNV